MSDPTEQDIQQQLSELDGEIDLVALEKPRNDSLRLFIDHDLRADYSLEVSSPGPKYRRNATPSEPKESLQ
jgi:hypothetical protein